MQVSGLKTKDSRPLWTSYEDTETSNWFKQYICSPPKPVLESCAAV